VGLLGRPIAVGQVLGSLEELAQHFERSGGRIWYGLGYSCNPPAAGTVGGELSI